MDKLLIVDKNEQTVDLISKLLLTANYDIYTANTGKVALAKINAINPDLILMDTDLSDTSGFDLCKKIKSSSDTKYIPVLMLITVETKDIILRSVHAGADDYLSKLFDGTILLSKIKSLLRVKHLSDRIKTQYQELKEKNELLNFQLRMARQVQRSIIKKINYKKNDVCILSKYLPALEVGGDFYNLVELDDSHVGVVIGDVSGHGISAALLTAMLSMMFNTIAANHSSPCKLLEEMNSQFYRIFEHTGNEMYVCMFYAIIDTEQKKVVYSNAGQPFPVFVDSITNTAYELELGGVPIGLMDTATYEDKTMSYSQNDYILLHTDGLSDFFYKESPDVFSDKLKKLLTQTIPVYKDSLDEIIKAVLDQFYYYDENKKFENDDVSIVICKL